MRMRKLAFVCLAFLGACSSHDPILPGVRTNIFDIGAVVVKNQDVPNVPDEIADVKYEQCPYTQDSTNVIRDGTRKIFTGFPTSNSVASQQTPVCSGGFVYAGLTTGELVKINPKNRHIEWIADIFSASNMTGGASTLDIIAPIVVRGTSVYAGGIGDAFCRVRASNGAKQWCVRIGVAQPFLVSDNVIYVVGTDRHLYAIAPADGSVYWRAGDKLSDAPKYKDGVVTVGKKKFNAASGAEIK